MSEDASPGEFCAPIPLAEMEFHCCARRARRFLLARHRIDETGLPQYGRGVMIVTGVSGTKITGSPSPSTVPVVIP